MIKLVKEQIFSIDEIEKEQIISTIKSYSDDDFLTLYKLCQLHDLAHIVFMALEDLNIILPEKIKSLFYSDNLRAIVRQERLQFAYNQLVEILRTEKIEFVPLKGIVIRNLYPKAYYRTSCDIDVLVDKEKIDQILSILTEKYHYKRYTGSEYDVMLIAENGEHIELHYGLDLRYKGEKINRITDNLFSDLILDSDGEYEKKFKSEFFFFYFVEHMAKHFIEGGCGVRSFIDLMLLKSIDGFESQEGIQLIKECNLLSFYQNAVRTCEVWFGGEQANEFTNSIEKYVIIGGAYGSFDNKVKVEQNRRGGKFKYFLSRIFLPYRVLKYQFPILKKHKWLFPFMQVARWFKRIFEGRTKTTLYEFTLNTSLTKQEIKETENMIDELGL